jgi:hypothetical protein
MPTVRLRKRLLDRLVKGANSASELGLALLMTAGVVHCGGDARVIGGEGGDARADHAGPSIEAAIEAAWFPDGNTTVVEAPAPAPEAGPGPIIEAPAPPHDGGIVPVIEAVFWDGGSPFVEAPAPPPHDAGSDVHPSPMIEAPTPVPLSVPDAAPDVYRAPWVEAAK